MNHFLKFFHIRIATVFVIFFLTSCKNEENEFDATGVFEAVETIVPAQANGIVLQMNVQEGQPVSVGEVVGVVDSTQLYLKKEQLLAQIKAVKSKIPHITQQTAAFKKQLLLVQSQINTLLVERKRVENLVNAEAATPKQLDDINGQLDALYKQMDVIKNQDIAQSSALSTQTDGLLSEQSPLRIQIDQVEDQLDKCRITNPVAGTVLTKYLEAGEMAIVGKPVYKIADLSTLFLRAYISGSQLTKLKLNQKVKVLAEGEKGNSKEQEGIVTWISSKAEFTPKTIQTKDGRANMVYATKILVKNNGSLKLGMYAEVKF